MNATATHQPATITARITTVAGIAEAWLVDLTGNAIERHSEPRNGFYRQITIARAGDTLASTVLTDLTIAVDTVLGTGEAP